jgi:hypothetical protein
MLSYEVSIALDDPTLAPALERYMIDTHLADVFATGCFVDAHFERAADGYRTRYSVASQEDLDRYVAEHATEMREDFAVHFPTGLRVTRAVWTELARC